jgi:hypothetical protein
MSPKKIRLRDQKPQSDPKGGKHHPQNPRHKHTSGSGGGGSDPGDVDPVRPGPPIPV